MKKKIILFCFITISFTNLFSQPLFIDNFNYPVRDTLNLIGNWNSYYQASPDQVKIVSPGLSYSGYLGSGSGNCAYFTNVPVGGGAGNFFGNEDAGTVYCSFLISVGNFTAGATEGYNICLDEAGGSTNLNTKFYIKKISTGTFNIGIIKYDQSPVYSSAVYNTNTVYLCVISYTFKPGSSTNDVSKAYIFASGVPATEPVTPAVLDSAGNDVNNIGDLFLSNSFIQTGLQQTPVKIDGIRFGKTWAGTLLQNLNVNLTLKALIQGFYNDVTNKMVKDTVTVSLRYNRSPYSLADSKKSVLDSNGNGTFTFNKVGNYAPYYIVVDHRNTLESWSRLPKEFELNNFNYDFTSSPFQTYGNNVITKGSKYCFYNGEIVHDGIIDVTDYQFVDNNSFIFATGYKTTDLNGDSVTDISDLAIVEMNSLNFVQVIKP